MTKRLEQVIARVGILPEAEQDAIAEIVLAEIEAEHRWEAAIAKSPEKLGRLADKAWRGSMRRGRAESLIRKNCEVENELGLPTIPR